VALAAIAATRTSCLILVPTRALLAQWVRALGEFWDGPVGRFGDGERSLGPVTVATFASAYRHMAMLGDRFGLMVVDEAHHFGGGARDEVLEMAIAPLRLGLSATPARDAELGANLSRLLGPLVFELAVGELAGGYLAPLDRLTWHLDLDPDERDAYEALRAVYQRAHREFWGPVSMGRGKTSSVRGPAPTRGDAGSPPGAGRPGCWPSRAASARRWGRCWRGTGGSGR
jgi:superfamily II DNA or RNA helicase